MPSSVWPVLICFDSWTSHSRFLCNIALYSIRLYFHPSSHPQLGVVFALALSLHSFWSSFTTLLSGQVAYWAPNDQGNSSFSVLSFSLFILFMQFSRQEYWSGLPFPSLVDHVLLELSTMTRPFWVALHGMAHSLLELDKAKIALKIYWAWPHPSEQDPVSSLVVSPIRKLV